MFKNKHNKCKDKPYTYFVKYLQNVTSYNFSPGAVKKFYNFLFIMKIKYIFVVKVKH